jgi:hypothetical protein
MIIRSVDYLVEQALEYDNTPDLQDSYSVTEVAELMDQEMRGAVIPLIVKCMEEYFVTPYQFEVGPNTSRITIPGDAAGFRVRDIYLYPNGMNSQIKAVRINPDQFPYLAPGSGSNGGWWGGRGPTYFIENNEIVFYPALAQSYTAQVRCFKSPNHLYPLLTCQGQITAKQSITNSVIVSNIPTGWDGEVVSPWTTVSGVNAATVDLVIPNSPFNFRKYSDTGLPVIGAPIISVDTTSNIIKLDPLTFAEAQIGDFLSTSGSLGYIQYLPYEAYNLIVVRASMRILKGQGDLQNLGISAQIYNAAADDLASLITPKVENAQMHVSNYDSPIGRGRSNGPWSR